MQVSEGAPRPAALLQLRQSARRRGRTGSFLLFLNRQVKPAGDVGLGPDEDAVVPFFRDIAASFALVSTDLAVALLVSCVGDCLEVARGIPQRTV